MSQKSRTQTRRARVMAALGAAILGLGVAPLSVATADDNAPDAELLISEMEQLGDEGMVPAPGTSGDPVELEPVEPDPVIPGEEEEPEPVESPEPAEPTEPEPAEPDPIDEADGNNQRSEKIEVPVKEAELVEPPVDDEAGLGEEATSEDEEELDQIMPMALGPDGAPPPYVYWDVKSPSGDLIGGASFTIERRVGSGWNAYWTDETTVQDCTSTPCNGLDKDPEPGEFLVKEFANHTINGSGRYRVTQISGQFTYDGTSYQRPSSNYERAETFGSWQDTLGFGMFVQRLVNVTAMPNPPLPNQCGLSIALVFDLSNSLEDADVTDSMDAGEAFIDTLEGTPSTVGIYTFATFAPAGSNTNLAATSVATEDGADLVRAHISNMTRPIEDHGGTNWDAGLGQIPNGYNMVVFITDGQPTAYGTPGTYPPGNNDYGNTFNQIDLDTAIVQANGLKSNGAFVMGLGVGDDVDENNIKAISGNARGTDYFLVDNYETLKAQLDELARKNCKGSVSVTKQIVDADGEVVDSSPAGWYFTAVTTGSVLVPETGPLVSSLVRVTDDETGAVNFRLDMGTDPTASQIVTISETQQENYVLVQQNGFNAVCEADEVSLPVTNNGDLGFDVDVAVNSIVACTVLNQEPPKLGALAIEKEYLDVPPATSEDVTFSGEYSCRIGAHETASGTWTATGKGDATLTETPGSVAPDQIPIGSSCTVTETGLDDSDLPNASWEWGTPTIEYPGAADAAIILANETANVVVTNTAQRVHSNFSVTKVLAGAELPAYSEIEFEGTWICTLDGESDVDGTWGPIVGGATWTSPKILAGSSCTVTETGPDNTDLPNASWEWGIPTIEYPGAADAASIVTNQTANVVVTNTAQRVYGDFSVTKVVDGTADVDLKYGGSWQCTLGEEVEEPIEGSWGPIEAGETWESASDLIPLGATCKVVSEDRPVHPVSGDPSYSWDGDPDFGEPVEAGADPAVITVTNTTKRELGTVTWTKVDESSNLLGGSEWSLTSTSELFDDVTIKDCSEATCVGPDMDQTAGQFLLEDLPWGEYTLKETRAPAGYYVNSTEFTFTIEGPDSLYLILEPVVNEQRDGPALPLTGGMSRDFFMIAGPSILLLGLGGAGFAHLRRIRREVA